MSTRIGFIVCYTGTALFISLCFYYAYKSWAFMRAQTHTMSTRTKALQRQFTRSLIFMTANSCIFAMLPLCIWCVSRMLRCERLLSSGQRRHAPHKFLPR